jgi:hypothetical protein
MTETEIKTIIQRELPNLIADDPLIRDFILRTVSNYYAGKQETETKFDRILAELQRDQEALIPPRGLCFVFGSEFLLFLLEKLKVWGGLICFFSSQGRSRTRAGFADRPFPILLL